MINIKQIKGNTIKKLTNAVRVRKTYENKHKDGSGNFGYVVVMKPDEWYRFDGDYGSDGVVYNLNINTYSGIYDSQKNYNEVELIKNALHRISMGDVKDKPKKDGYDEEWIEKWGFDLTDFRSAKTFQNLLDDFNLNKITVEQRKTTMRTYKTWTWSNKDGSLFMVTSHNPLTGEMSWGYFGEKGYAGYIGIEGVARQGGYNPVIDLAYKIRRYNPKGESPHDREFT